MKKNDFSWTGFAITGMGIGFPITTLCVGLAGGWDGVALGMLTWAVASALFGLVSGLVFYKSNLNLLAATVVHFLCCLTIAVAAGMICGYADNVLTLLGGIAPVFVVIYAVVYGCIYFAMKKEAEKVNKSLNEN